MDKESIIIEIEKVIKTYSSWSIGITHNPSHRKNELENDKDYIDNWKQWIAESLTDAHDIENYFLDKGCKGNAGELNQNLVIYVYIY
jgi:hypothetical protein